jgi:anthranilate phosphoribosyltransferase
VSSADGLDEMSTSAPTHVVEVNAEELSRLTVDAAELGLPRADPQELAGGTPESNAQTTRAILDGAPGPPRDLAALNAGAAIYAAGRADTLEAGVRAAEAAIDSGAGGELLERFVARTRELAT